MSVVISQQVLEEVVRTVKYKLPGALPALRTLLMNAPLEVSKDAASEEVVGWAELIDKGDAAILAAAIAAQPDYLITGDKHFLDNPNVGKKSGLTIISPADFLKFLEKEH